MLSVWSKRLTHFSKYFLLLSIAFFFSPAYVLSLFNPCKSTSSQLCKDSMTSLLLVCVLPYLFLLGVPWLHFACLRWEMVCLPTTASSLEKEMTTHSSVLAWRIPGTGEPGGLPSMGSHRVGHDWSDLAAAAAAALSWKCHLFWIICLCWVGPKMNLVRYYDPGLAIDIYGWNLPLKENRNQAEFSKPCSETQRLGCGKWESSFEADGNISDVDSSG